MDRPTVNIKNNLRQQQCCEMLDLRDGKPLTLEDHQRRMKRERIPDTQETSKVDVVGRFWSCEKIGRRKKDHLKKLLPVLTDKFIDQVIIPIISVSSRISLRALDWFVINYSKKHKIALLNKKTHLLCVYDDYRAWLRFWKRPLFDAFRRGTRVYFEKNGIYYSTTVAQLNFLYWSEKNGILNYVDAHLETIEADMNSVINRCRREKEQLLKAGKKRKRCDLSISPKVKCLVYKVPITIRF